MQDFNSVLDGAKQLSADDQLRLIDAIWDLVPDDAALRLHEDWGPELERRVAALRDGSVTAVSWATIRNEALARIGHGESP